MEEVIRPAREGSRLDHLSALAKADAAVNQTDHAMVPMTGREVSTIELMTAQQVARPRDIPKFLQTIKTLAQVAGDTYFYSFPVRVKNEDGEWENGTIEGPTIRLAQDLAREFGNCAVETRVFDIGESWAIYARFVDLETGFNYTRPYIQRKDQKSIGTKDKGRAQDIAFQIGASKAIRNVIVNVLGTYADMMFDEAKGGLVGQVKAKLQVYKDKILMRLQELKIGLARVEAQVGYKIAEWTPEATTKVICQLRGVQEGMATADEIWPRPESYIDPNAPKETGEKRPERGDKGNAPSDAKAEDKPGGSQAGGGAGDAREATVQNQAADHPTNDGAGAGSREGAGGAERTGEVGSGHGSDGPAQGASDAAAESQAANSDAAEEEADLLQTALREIDQCQDETALGVLTEQAAARLSEGAMAIFDQQAKKRVKVLKAKAKK